MWIENGEYRVKSSQGGSLGGKGRMGTCVCMAKSLRSPPETHIVNQLYSNIKQKVFEKMVKKKEKAKVGVRKGKDLKHWRKKHLTGAPLRLEFGSRNLWEILLIPLIFSTYQVDTGCLLAVIRVSLLAGYSRLKGVLICSAVIPAHPRRDAAFGCW